MTASRLDPSARRFSVVVAVLVALPGGGTAAVETAAPVAVAATADTVYAIDGSRAAIVALGIEPRAAGLTAPRDVVADRGDGSQLVTVAVAERRLLAAIRRAGDAWTLETWNLEPGGAAAPLQTLALGSAAGSAAGVSLAVSPSGAWLAIAGLPPPLAPVQRAAIAGRRISPPSPRNCPRPARVPTAIAVSPNDDLVIFEPAAGDGSVTLAFHGIGGRELLRLETGLDSVRHAGFDPADGSLLVVGERRDTSSRATGLWRLDAALDGGRQAIRPVLVAALGAPRAMAVVTDHAIAVAPGTDGRAVEIVRTVTEPETSTGDQPR